MCIAEGLPANPVCYKWLGRRNNILVLWGGPRAETYPACARFKFGRGRFGEVRCAAGIPVRIAGNRGKIAALAPNAGIPALLPERGLEAVGGQLDFPRNISTLRKQGVDSFLELDYIAH